MTITHTEAEIQARHDARVAQLREAFGEMTSVPQALLARLHELNARDWRLFVAERDSKKVSETIVPALIDIEAVIRASSRTKGTLGAQLVGKSPATPGVDRSGKISFVGGSGLDTAYAALVGTAPGLDGRIDARRSLAGLPKID